MGHRLLKGFVVTVVAVELGLRNLIENEAPLSEDVNQSTRRAGAIDDLVWLVVWFYPKSRIGAIGRYVKQVVCNPLRVKVLVEVGENKDLVIEKFRMKMPVSLSKDIMGPED